MRVRSACSFLALLFSLTALTPVEAQTYGQLPASVPDTYKTTTVDRSAYGESVSALVRLEALRLVIEGPGKATLYGRKVVTVFEEDGRKYGQLQKRYDSLVEIEDLEGRLLDAQGNEIQELDDEHLSDFSATRSFSLYSDARVRIARLYADSYPYTVDYRYELEMTTPLKWPTWFPQWPEIPTEFGQFQVEHPKRHGLRHYVRGDMISETSSQVDGRHIHRWRVTDRPPYRREPYGPSWSEAAPMVHISPDSFETAGISGNMKTWAGFGRWFHRLKASRDELSSPAAQKMRELVKGASTRRDTVRRLYRHLQKETRYVSVQLGIGGWQPFPASYVQERGYGDCKALTNYLEASLAAVGVSSHPVLIYRGDPPRPVTTDFPSNQFNHVVLAVPLERDTLWLENTDTTAPFGHVAADIEDRYGLMVTPKGGKLVRTPDSPASANRRIRTATVTLKANGDGGATVRTTYTGNQQDRIRKALTDASPRKRRKWLRQRMEIPTFRFRSIDFTELDAYQDSLSLPLKMRLPRYASTTGSRLFLPLNLMGGWEDVPSEMEEARTQPVHASPYPFRDVDSIRYVLPASYEVEAMPEPVSIETDFATYKASVTRTNEGLLYRRHLVWKKEKLPADKYEAFRSFRKKVVRADQVQAVLVKKT